MDGWTKNKSSVQCSCVCLEPSNTIDCLEHSSSQFFRLCIVWFVFVTSSFPLLVLSSLTSHGLSPSLGLSRMHFILTLQKISIASPSSSFRPSTGPCSGTRSVWMSITTGRTSVMNSKAFAFISPNSSLGILTP